MINFKMVAMSVMLIGSQCGIALAQGDAGGADPKTLSEGSMTYTTSDGVMVMRAVPSETMAEIMKNGAMPMTDGVMMMKHNGKMYMVTDHKMPNGTMMSDLAMPGMMKRK